MSCTLAPSSGRWCSSTSPRMLPVTGLALTLARAWPGVLSNAVDPGWVPTKMGGPAATGEALWPFGHRHGNRPCRQVNASTNILLSSILADMAAKPMTGQAFFVLTALIDRPDRLIYRSSGLHPAGAGSLSDIDWSGRRWDALQAYS